MTATKREVPTPYGGYVTKVTETPDGDVQHVNIDAMPAAEGAATEETLAAILDSMPPTFVQGGSNIPIVALADWTGVVPTNPVDIKGMLDALQVTLGDIFAVLQRTAWGDIATVTTVSSSLTSVTLFSGNSNRRVGIVHNNSTQRLYIKFGQNATTSDYTYMLEPYGNIEMFYAGEISGVWASVNGAARCTETSVNVGGGGE